MKRGQIVCIAGILALSAAQGVFAQETMSLSTEEAMEIAERADDKWERETYYGEEDSLYIDTTLTITSVTSDNEKLSNSIPFVVKISGTLLTDDETGWLKKDIHLTASSEIFGEFELEEAFYIYEDGNVVRVYLPEYSDSDANEQWMYYEAEDIIRNNELYSSVGELLEKWNKYNELLQFDVSMRENYIDLTSTISLADMKDFVDRYEDVDITLESEAENKLKEWLSSVVFNYIYTIDAETETAYKIHVDLVGTDMTKLNEFLVEMQKLYYQERNPELLENETYFTLDEGSVVFEILKMDMQEEHLPVPEEVEGAVQIEDIQEFLTRHLGFDLGDVLGS